MKSESQTDDKEKARDKIAETIQTLTEFRFQVFRARDLPVASIENTVDLKDGRAGDDAGVITAR